MGLKELRQRRNMSQKELANMCGINFRSLQDYEQGHKKLTSANGDVLLRLSTVLGCSITELLISDTIIEPNLCKENTVDPMTIQNQRIFCEKHNIGGRWICGNNSVATLFYYNGKQYTLPFRAVFTPVMLSCLAEAAALQIAEAVDNILLQESGFEEW